MVRIQTPNLLGDQRTNLYMVSLFYKYKNIQGVITMQSEVPVSLSTVCGGSLEEQFQKIYPAVISQLRPGNSGSISVTLKFKRMEDTATMVTTSFSLTPKFPAVKKASICQITGEGKLKTDAPVESKVTQLNLVAGGNE